MNNFIEWSSIFEICPEVDKQHKKLCSIINELYEAYIKTVETYKLAIILKELKEYSKYHFTTEEKLFAKYNYSLKEEHIKEHQSFKDEINKFVKKYNEDDAMLAQDMLDYLKDWLLNHILNEDKKYINEICPD